MLYAQYINLISKRRIELLDSYHKNYSESGHAVRSRYSKHVIAKHQIESLDGSHKNSGETGHAQDRNKLAKRRVGPLDVSQTTIGYLYARYC